MSLCTIPRCGRSIDDQSRLNMCMEHTADVHLTCLLLVRVLPYCDVALQLLFHIVLPHQT